MSVGEVALNQPEEPVFELALALYRLGDKPPLLLEGPGSHALEDLVPLLHPAPYLCEVFPVFLGEMAVELLEEPVFELALALEQVHDPLELELLGVLVL